MAHESFAGQVMAAMISLAAKSTTGRVHVDDVSDALMVQTRAQHKQVLNACSDLYKAGRLVRVQQGVYSLVADGRRKPDKRETMWRLLRMRRQVIIADLVELAGVTKEYAKEWLQMLDKRGVVRRIPRPNNQPHIWQLVHDTVAMPVDEAKAAKLRELRLRKKQQAMADLLTARELIGKAVMAINDLEADHE